MNADKEILLATLVGEDGGLNNVFNQPLFLKHHEKLKLMPDVYLVFVLKTIIDDYGDFLVKTTNGKLNKEQFEAQFVANLTEMLSKKTRRDDE